MFILYILWQSGTVKTPLKILLNKIPIVYLHFLKANMSFPKLFCILTFIFIWHLSIGQGKKVQPASTEYQKEYIPENAHLLYWVIKNTDTGKSIIYYYSAGCKRYISNTNIFPNDTIVTSRAVINTVEPKKEKVKFLTVHGNVSYDYYSRSKDEVAVNQDNYQQHTERIYLDVLVKEKYPLKVNFASRQSNSPFFKNFYDINFQFDRYSYTKNLKQQLLTKLNKQIPEYKYPDLSEAETQLKKQKDEYAAAKKWLDAPATLQKIIEERERVYYKNVKAKEDSIKNNLKYEKSGKLNEMQGSTTQTDSLSSEKNKLLNKKDDVTGKVTGEKDQISDSLTSIKNKITDEKDSATAKLDAKKDKITDSLSSIENKASNRKDSITGKVKNKADSVAAPFAKQYEKEKRRLDSLSKRIDSLTKRVDSIRNKVEKNVQRTRQKINSSASEKDLQKIAADNGIELDKDGKLQKRLAALKSFSIGRSMLNYTELTAQNITVTGVNIEYNPSYYAAFAAGKIDYRFRDFLNKNIPHNSQYIIMGRVGIGDKDHKALIFSYFTGRKNTADFSLSDSVKNYVNIVGYSLEAIYKKDENTSLSAEFAKSTKPVTGSLTANKEPGSLVKFSDKSNMGINIKAQTIFPETNTRLSGFFRKTGENFQSFSLFSYNTDQTAWLLRADQSFLKSRITVTGMLRRNDFTNPFTDKTYKTSTVFKSIQMNIRFPKYPSISIGYYPGTQLYVVNKERIRESAYYILNGSASYSYLFKRISMNSLFVYNRYSNEATDSGFIAYKGINYYALQTLFLKKLQLQGGYSYSKQPELQFYTLETSLEFAIRNWLRVGAGVKYNDIKGGNNYWGEKGQLTVKLWHLGDVQLQYEKSYLPTINQTLYPVETGRVSYFKNF